jgi:flagellar basal-body rod protein FlgB
MGIAYLLCIRSRMERMVVSKLDSTLFLQQQALTLRANRQQVLAGNIANADTPNYLARDFDFSAALGNALAGRGAANLTMTATSPRHLQRSAHGDALRLQYRQPTQPSADGNTVEMDVERSQFAENAVSYEASMTFITHQIRALTAALQP